MRGKRKLQKIEGMSSHTIHVYECESCTWTFDVPANLAVREIQSKFDGHDCKANGLNKKTPRDRC
jgi:hypothetical protein